MSHKGGKMPRRRLSVTLPDDVYLWLQKKVEDRTYYNFSDAIEKCVREKMKEKANPKL